MFAVVALLLAGVGIYGVTSYAVAQQTREIGIRLALGASGDRVMREVVRHGLLLTMIAVLAGVAGAMVLGRVIRGCCSASLPQIRPRFLRPAVCSVSCRWPPATCPHAVRRASIRWWRWRRSDEGAKQVERAGKARREDGGEGFALMIG